ncbi:unnamed protein product [Thelazia callipaeda]|uniref:ANK_REP_REGION domain-containing protein n=1 Tax=Thelazia callipaeda TaxID=103827 RepID=A0A0N5CRA5_THECL|nr:unnamed protein product [Thelazia callipaeda]
MKQGDRVRIANYDCSFYERLNSYNKLTWSPRMAMYIGKIGIIREITVESVQVTFFSWGPAEATTTISSNSSTHKDKKVFSETIRNTLVEATYSWHPKVVLSAQTICMLDGDRAILIRDKVYYLSSQNLSFLMRDRNLPTHLVNINRTPARVVFGTNAVEQNSNNIVEALKYWAETGDDQKFRLALHYDPDSVTNFAFKLLIILLFYYICMKNAVIDGQTPLMIAVDLGLWTATAALICMGAETKVSDPHGNGLYHIAAKRSIFYYLICLLN